MRCGRSAASSAFFEDVIEAFRTDARQILKELGAAAAAGNVDAFTAGIQALRNCTASFGGAPLREMLLSMQQITAGELRRIGVGELVQEPGRRDRAARPGAGRIPKDGGVDRRGYSRRVRYPLSPSSGIPSVVPSRRRTISPRTRSRFSQQTCR